MDREWRPFDDNCDKCGDCVEVYTACGENNMAQDGDEARCMGCGLKGWVSIVDTVYINWIWEEEAENA